MIIGLTFSGSSQPLENRIAQTMRQGLPAGLVNLLDTTAQEGQRSGMAVFKKPVPIQDLVDFLQREIG